MNPSGLWRGITEYDGRVGHFKFINVEMIPKRRSTERKSRKRSNVSGKGNTKHNQNGNEESVVYQAPNENSIDPSGKQEFDEDSSERKYTSINTNIRDNEGALEGLKGYSQDHPSSLTEESNSDSRHKPVEDILRRIGLEVSYFRIIICIILIVKNE